MSILSTNKKLIKVGAEYSAGSGISIDDYVISVTGDVGKTYSAGDNIGIYTQDNQLYISGKDWEQDIANASANAYEQAVAQIPQPQDLSFISAQIDNKLNSSDFSDWQNGQYSTDLQTIEGQINNKLDSSSFSDVSGNFLTAINIPESATWNETSNVVKESSANWDNTSDLVKESSASWNQGKTYEGISPIVVNNDENKVSAETWTFSAGEGVSFVDDNVNKITRIDVTAQGGDVEVNSFVYDNSATILDVDSSYKANSGNFYPTNNPSGFITGVDLSNFYTKDETSGKEELANAFANIPVGDPEVNAYVTSNSASIDESTDLVQSNSSTWNDVTAYQSNSGSYLTAINIPESATWNDTSNVVQSNSAQWAEGGATYTSPSGTILINGDTLEGTNSAITRVDVEGFVSSYGGKPVGPNDTAIYTWDKALPTNTITLDTWATRDTLYWSANTNLTGEIVLPDAGRTTQLISIPNATAFAAWSNNYHNINGATASAADTFEPVVCELAWASALPSYEYDISNKISAINGSAIAGGDEFPASANDAITAYQTNSGTYITNNDLVWSYVEV